MKKSNITRHFLIFAVFILFFNLFSAELYAGSDPSKHALIIAIGNYNRSVTGWSPISSENDIPLIKTMLMNQGFDEENIALLQDAEADKEGILKALNTLIETVSEGDYVVVHYSGHGQQISDDNGDEIDGLDEALVTINAPSSYKKKANYKGEDHLRDEELGNIIDLLRTKVGKNGQVVIILDACHSGTGTRGDGIVRGGEEPLIIPGQNVANNNAVEDEGFGMNESANKSRGNDEDKAPYILFAGAKFDELNYETKDENGKGVGSLSFAISKAFSEVKTNSTYQSVFARILEIMEEIAPHQTPMIEGDINYKVFNGEVVEQEFYYEIEKVIDTDKIQINGGNVTGIGKGDKIGFYKSGTASIDNEEAIITGIVIETGNFNSVVKFENDHNIKNKKSYWAFIEACNLEDSYSNIYLEKLDDDISSSLLEKLKNINNISNVTDNKNNADILVTSIKPKTKSREKDTRGSSKLYITSAKSGFVIKEVKLNKTKDEISKEVSQIIKNYSQAKFIKDIELEDEDYKVEIEFVPVNPERDSYGKIKKDNAGNFIIKDTLNIEDYVKDGVIEFTMNDVLMIRIKNTGNKNAFFSIIDIQPDGVINAFYPTGNISPEECFIKAGKSYVPRNFIVNGFGEPWGKETFKVFANKSKIDLSPIVTSRGEADARGGANSLELLINNSYKSRGPKPETGSVSNKDTGSSKMYPFIIKKK